MSSNHSSVPSSTVVDPAPRAARQWPRVLGIILGVVLLLVGLIGLLDVTTRSVSIRTDGVPTATVEGIAVVTGAGSVALYPIAGDQIEIESTARSSLFGEAVVSHRVVGSTLEITGRCERAWASMCQTSFRVGVPDDMPFELDLTTTAGDIVIRGLPVLELKATTSAGDVTASLAAQPEDVVLRTTAGDVDLTVPAGTYDVDANTRAGDIIIEVDQNARSTRSIAVSTTAGDVVVRER